MSDWVAIVVTFASLAGLVYLAWRIHRLVGRSPLRVIFGWVAKWLFLAMTLAYSLDHLDANVSPSGFWETLAVYIGTSTMLTLWGTVFYLALDRNSEGEKIRE